MSNSTFEAIFMRRSCRAYTGQKVGDETVALLAKATLAAPSGSNAQPVNLIVVQNVPLILELEKAVVDYFAKNGDETIRERIKSRKNKIFYDASTVFFLAVKNKAHIDAGIMSENLAIAATSLGLANIILGLPGVIFNDPDPRRTGKKNSASPKVMSTALP
ncbi:MAG: nitroreductase family protein [Treponema sp.]|jgi:nitroreductase|nr:nitroreductase family protein [Treponema sp.]